MNICDIDNLRKIELILEDGSVHQVRMYELIIGDLCRIYDTNEDGSESLLGTFIVETTPSQDSDIDDHWDMFATRVDDKEE